MLECLVFILLYIFFICSLFFSVLSLHDEEYYSDSKKKKVICSILTSTTKLKIQLVLVLEANLIETVMWEVVYVDVESG